MPFYRGWSLLNEVLLVFFLNSHFNPKNGVTGSMDVQLTWEWEQRSGCQSRLASLEGRLSLRCRGGFRTQDCCRGVSWARLRHEAWLFSSIGAWGVRLHFGLLGPQMFNISVSLLFSFFLTINSAAVFNSTSWMLSKSCHLARFEAVPLQAFFVRKPSKSLQRRQFWRFENEFHYLCTVC